MRLFEPEYLRVYLTIIGATVGLLAVEFVLDPPLIVGLVLVGIASLVVLSAGRHHLQLADTFPELGAPATHPADHRMSAGHRMNEPIDPALAALAERLAAGGVRWAVIRGDTDRPRGDDLDLLVHPEDASAFRSIARDVGFPRLPAWGHGEHIFHVGRGTGGWWRLDLLTSFRFSGGQRLADDVVPAVLARRTADRVPTLAPDDTAWALVLHLLLDKDVVSDQDHERLARGR